MATTEVPWAKKPSADLEDFDIDEMLSKLSTEEIEKLEAELFDPDDPHLPPSDRCQYRTEKKPSAPFDRKHLIDHLEKQAKEEKDWEEAKPYVKEKRGKVYQPKPESKPGKVSDDGLETEWDDVLAHATEEDLVDLAAIMGFHGMLNQVQYHQAFEEGKTEEERAKGGFHGIAKHTALRLVPKEPPNDVDVDDILTKIKDNDPKLKVINLNNVKNISIERLCEFAESLKTNTQVEEFLMANTRANDKVALAFAEGLKGNKTLKLLNMESNFITGPSIVEILKGINEHESLTEFRIANQRQSVLGNKIEFQIAKLVCENSSLLKFGIVLQIPDSRIKVSTYLQRNNDNMRKKRMGIEEEAKSK